MNIKKKSYKTRDPKRSEASIRCIEIGIFRKKFNNSHMSFLLINHKRISCSNRLNKQNSKNKNQIHTFGRGKREAPSFVAWSMFAPFSIKTLTTSTWPFYIIFLNIFKIKGNNSIETRQRLQ